MVSLLIAVSVTTSSAGGLGAAIDACLQVRAEVEASRQLEAILARADATPEAVLAALHASEGSVAAETELAIPYCNQLLLARVRAPAATTRAARCRRWCSTSPVDRRPSSSRCVMRSWSRRAATRRPSSATRGAMPS
ncbi:MAG: hypothetical protein U1E76_14200 [Planctomycetota bacterium]